MPCYTQQTATVQFGKNTDLELLSEALKLQGYTVTIRGTDLFFHKGYYARIDGSFGRETGKLTFEENTLDVAKLKRDYSEQVITATAKRNGWQLQWSVNASGNRQAEIVRVSR